MSTPVSTAAPTPTPVRARVIAAWALWDWGSAAFNAVVTTFVFTVYLTSGSFGSEAAVSAQLGWALAGAGVLIALLAPVTGMRADRASRRTLWLGVNTGIVVLATALMFFIRPEPDLLWFGLILLAVGNVFFEFASVNYNAMLPQ
ncbi:MAG: MFS transporter, partial [Mycetocola sp.]